MYRLACCMQANFALGSCPQCDPRLLSMTFCGGSMMSGKSYRIHLAIKLPHTFVIALLDGTLACGSRCVCFRLRALLRQAYANALLHARRSWQPRTEQPNLAYFFLMWPSSVLVHWMPYAAASLGRFQLAKSTIVCLRAISSNITTLDKHHALTYAAVADQDSQAGLAKGLEF